MRMRARTWRRLAFGAAWFVGMVAVAVGTYALLSGARKSHTTSRTVTAPSATTPIFKLPGTLYLAHNGGLYRMQDGVFTELQAPAGWSQPGMAPDGRRLAAVRRGGLNYSDLYLIDAGNGQVGPALTHNAAGLVELNHWAFYPRFSPDGQTVFFSTDSPKDFSYRVDLAIWALAVGAAPDKAVRWTDPNEYTGGDVSPIPTQTGLLYVKYDVSSEGKSFSQLWFTPRPRDPGHALTDPADSCAQPALSPDGTQVAMICSADQRTSRLVVAPFDGNSLGPLRTLIDGQLVAAPAWAPDGGSLIYLAPATGSGAGHFQLWYLQVLPPQPVTPAATAQAGASPSSTTSPGRPSPTATPTPPPSPRQVTNNLDFDALSPPVWIRT